MRDSERPITFQSGHLTWFPGSPPVLRNIYFLIVQWLNLCFKMLNYCKCITLAQPPRFLPLRSQWLFPFLMPVLCVTRAFLCIGLGGRFTLCHSGSQ